MDATRFDNALIGALADVDGEFYTDTVRHEATLRAVGEYSQFRPTKRRFGVGKLFSAASAGDATFTVVGGLWSPGDSVTIGNPGRASETVTVSDAQPGEWADNQTCPTVTITPTAVLASAHAAGELATNAMTGLQLAAGQDTYLLPFDLLKIDQDSFDMAVGAKASVQKGDGFYSAVYEFSNALSGQGFGYAQNYGMSSLWGNFPIVGDPRDNPNGGGNLPMQQVFQFLQDNPPMLVTQPAPLQATTLANLYYYGMLSSVEQVPEHDVSAVLGFAKMSCLEAAVAVLGVRGDQTKGDVRANYGATVKDLNNAIDAARHDWEVRIVKRPFARAG